MTKCVFCRAELGPGAHTCAGCGQPAIPATPGPSNTALILIVLAIVLIGFAFYERYRVGAKTAPAATEIQHAG